MSCRCLSLIPLLLVLSLNTFAQTIICKDKDNQKPISRVHLSIKSLDGLSIFNGYTNKSGGAFLDGLVPNKIIVSSKHISYADGIDTISTIKDSIFIELSHMLYPLNEVVVTGQFEEKKRGESFDNIVTISRKQIEETASINLTDVLNQQALFDVQIDPAIGTSISIQGMQGNNMNILIDGVPVIGRKGSQIDISQLNLANIERIEVLKGPASVSYGTNSTGGVINLITKNDVAQDKIEMSTYQENIGVAQINLNMQKKIEQQNIIVNIGKYKFDGFSEDTLRNQEWKSKEQFFSDFIWQTKINKTQLRFKTSFFDEEIIELGNENFPPFDGTATDQYFLTYRNINDIKLTHKNDRYTINGISSYAKTKFNKAQYNINLEDNSRNQTDNPDYNAEDVFEAFYSRWEYNRLNWDKINAQFGAEIRKEKVFGSKIQKEEAETFECAYFTKAEYNFSEQWKTQIGFRIPYHSMYNAPITPSIHIQHNRKSSTQWRASYARGFRAPSIKELFMEFVDFNHNIVGNDNLNAEYSNAFNSSVSLTPIKGEQRYLQIDIESSFQDMKNKISLAQIENSTGYTYYNLSKSIYYGFHTSIQAKASQSSNLQISWNRYTTDAEEFYEPITNQNFSFRYQFNSKKDHFAANITMKMKSKNTFQRLEEDNLVNFEQEGYEIINMNLIKTFPNINATLSCGVKNLTNVKNILDQAGGGAHSGSESIISWGRTYFLQYKIIFQ